MGKVKNKPMSIKKPESLPVFLGLNNFIKFPETP